MSVQMSGQILDYISDRISYRISDWISDQISNRISHRISVRISDQISDRILDRISNQISDWISNTGALPEMPAHQKTRGRHKYGSKIDSPSSSCNIPGQLCYVFGPFFPKKNCIHPWFSQNILHATTRGKKISQLTEFDGTHVFAF